MYSSVLCCNKTESADYRRDEENVEAGIDSEGEAGEPLLARESEVHDMVEVDDKRYVPRESNRTKCFKMFGCSLKSANEFNTTEEQEEEIDIGMLSDEDLTGESMYNASDVKNVVVDAMELEVFSGPEDQDEVISK